MTTKIPTAVIRIGDVPFENTGMMTTSEELLA